MPLEKAVACIYLNGAEYIDNEKRHHDTWDALKPDAPDMIQSVKVEKVESSGIFQVSLGA